MVVVEPEMSEEFRPSKVGRIFVGDEEVFSEIYDFYESDLNVKTYVSNAFARHLKRAIFLVNV